MVQDHRVLDSAAWISAGVAAVSFWQGVALALTIVAALVSVVLGLIRLHDRIRYGPAK